MKTWRVQLAINTVGYMVEDGYTFSYALDWATCELTQMERLEVLSHNFS